MTLPWGEVQDAGSMSDPSAKSRPIVLGRAWGAGWGDHREQSFRARRITFFRGEITAKHSSETTRIIKITSRRFADLPGSWTRPSLLTA